MGHEILDLPMSENDAGAKTVRGYLKRLLMELWEQGEGFSGKRPFGNSDWEYDIYHALATAGKAPGTVDEDGFPEDTTEAHKLVRHAIWDL